MKPASLSDHCSMVTCVLDRLDSFPSLPKPFKFLNFWCLDKLFLDIVTDQWYMGSSPPLVELASNLRRLKAPFRRLHASRYRNLSGQLRSAEVTLHHLQERIMSGAMGDLLAKQEREAKYSYLSLLRLDLEAVYQKAKADFVKKNDENVGYFHARVADRRSSASITSVCRPDGILCSTPVEVGAAFVEFFKELLGVHIIVDLSSLPSLHGPVISHSESQTLLVLPDLEEVKHALFSMGNNKSPGPEGFSPFFFKKAWSIIHISIFDAITEFFGTGIMPKGMNSAFLTLVPKTVRPTMVSDYRPIALCNVTYKIVTKVLANRLKQVLPSIIGEEQAAFIPNRLLHENVFIAHDIMKHYGWRNISPRICFKIDLRKAFDSVSWDFLGEAMKVLGLPQIFVDRVLACVTSPWFSVLVNGSPHGYFQGKKGLRQGDPLSPYLFVICMEFLSRLLKKRLDNSMLHPGCKKCRVSHLFFADDLLIFVRGTKVAMKTVLECLEEFSLMTGLKINKEKTDVYFGGISTEEKS